MPQRPGHAEDPEEEERGTRPTCGEAECASSATAFAGVRSPRRAVRRETPHWRSAAAVPGLSTRCTRNLGQAQAAERSRCVPVWKEDRRADQADTLQLAIYGRMGVARRNVDRSMRTFSTSGRAAIRPSLRGGPNREFLRPEVARDLSAAKCRARGKLRCGVPTQIVPVAQRRRAACARGCAAGCSPS